MNALSRALGVVDRLDLLAVLRGALRIEEEGPVVSSAQGPPSAPTMPAIWRPELKTYWLAVPLGQNPPPMVEEPSRVHADLAGGSSPQ